MKGLVGLRAAVWLVFAICSGWMATAAAGGAPAAPAAPAALQGRQQPDHGGKGGSSLDAAPSYTKSTQQLIVKYKEPALAKARSMSAAHVDSLSARAGVRLTHLRRMSGNSQVYRLPGRLTMEKAEAIAQKLKGDSSVEYAEPDRQMSMAMLPGDPQYPQQWHYKSPEAPDREAAGINLPAAWDISTGSASVVIGVVDTGVVDHADLKTRILPGYNFISSPFMAGNGVGRSADASDLGDGLLADQCFAGSLPQNSSWHGTHVAGTIGAISDNGTGVAGIDWNAKILPVRVLGKCGGYWSDIADGLRWAAGISTDEALPVNNTPARVLNLSFGGGGACGPSVQDAIDDVVNAGTAVVAAAGNWGGFAAHFTPANCNGVIAVAAVNRAGGRAYYTDYGPPVSIAAPGGEMFWSGGAGGILSTLNTGTASPAPSPAGDSYGFYQGTSMAAPHVTGTASLMLSLNPALTPLQLSRLLQLSARPFPTGTGSLDGDCDTWYCGAGLLDAFGALQAVNANAPVIFTAPTAIEFKIPFSGNTPPDQTVSVDNAGSGILNWTASSSVPWLKVKPSSGVNGGVVTVSVDVTALDGSGRYEGAITITSPGAYKPSVTVPVHATASLDLHAPIPSPTSSPALAAVGGKIYAIGGWWGGWFGGSRVQIYDTASDTWSTGAAKPTPTAQMNAAVIDGKIYVPGGRDTNTDAFVDALEIYDPATDQWSTGAPMPRALEGFALETVQGKLYLFGGQAYPETYGDAYVYDPATDAWSTVPAMRSYRSYPASGVVNGKIYAAGGWHDGLTGITESLFPPISQWWSLEGELITPRVFHAGAAASGRFFVFGGSGKYWHNLESIEVYDSSSMTWREVPFTLNQRRTEAKAVASGSRIYVMGGVDASGAVSAINESFPVVTPAPVVNSFSVADSGDSLTVPVKSFSASSPVGVAGYLVTTTSYPPPAASDSRWSASPPTTVSARDYGSTSFYAWAKDFLGNVSAPAMATVVILDATPPVISSFALPASCNTLAVPVPKFVASDNVGVTGYLITRSELIPLPDDEGWSSTPPAKVAAAAPGPATFYAWVKDAVGHVTRSSATVNIDLTAPTVNVTAKFLVNTLKVPVTVSASDGSGGSGVAGYMIKSASTPPLASSAGWSTTAPTAFAFPSAGPKLLYVWAKDAAGNVSATKSVRVVVDVTAPVALLTVRSAVNTLKVPVTVRTSDGSTGSGVSGYMLKTSPLAPLASSSGWSATAPTSYTFPSAGPKILYLWVKDQAGNVSVASSARVNVDLAPPVVAFAMKTMFSTLKVPLLLTASDGSAGSGVTGYLVTTTGTPPLASGGGWSATSPTSYTFSSKGSKTLYAWARDAAGNVSAPKKVSFLIQ